jgi:hypothetical protein
MFLPQRKYEVENSVSHSCIICIFPCMPAAKHTVRVEYSTYTCFILVGFFIRPHFIDSIRIRETRGALNVC